VLLALVCAGALLRLVQTRDSLWVDELHTAWTALGSLGDVLPRAAIGNQSPLFFWGQWLLVRLFGPSELTLRLTSVVAGSLLPLALCLLALRHTGARPVALAVAGLAAFDPLLLFFASEARPYAALQLLAVAHVGLLLETWRQPTRARRLGLVGGAALLFHWHYTAALLLLAEAAGYGLVCWRRRGALAYRPAQAGLDGLAAAALCLPAAPLLLAIFDRRHNWAEFIPQRPWWQMLDPLPWSGGAAVLVLGWLASALWRGRQAEPTPGAGDQAQAGDFAVLVLSWLLVPLAAAWLLTRLDIARLFFPRYLAASAPAALLAAALCTELLPARWAKGLAAGLLVLAGVVTSGIPQQLAIDGRALADRAEDWRGAVAWLNTQLEPDDAVLVASGLIEANALVVSQDPLLAEYCLAPVMSLYRLKIERARLEPLPYSNLGELPPAARDLARQHARTWLVVRGRREAASRVERAAIDALALPATGERPRQWRVSQRASFGRVQVIALSRTE